MSPIYSYECEKHGTFEVIKQMTSCTVAPCPTCGVDSTRVVSRPARIVMVERERLPLGSGSRGRFVSHAETGGMDIFVPSFGTMEKEEVDFVTQGAVEKEKARVRHQRTERRAEKQIGELISLAYATKPGQRLKTIKEAAKRF